MIDLLNELITESDTDNDMLNEPIDDSKNDNLVPVFGIAMTYTKDTNLRNDGTEKDEHDLDYSKFSRLIKSSTNGDNYSHAVISFDDTLTKMYSFSDEGFVIESINDDIYKTTESIYICVMFVKEEDRDKMKKYVDYLIANKDQTEYDFANLLRLAIFKPAKIDKRFICSSFVGYLLNYADPKNLHRDYSRIRPEDITILPRSFYVANVKDQKEFYQKYNDIHNRVKEIYKEHHDEIDDYNNHLPKLMLQDKMDKLRTIDKILDKIVWTFT